MYHSALILNSINREAEYLACLSRASPDAPNITNTNVPLMNLAIEHAIIYSCPKWEQGRRHQEIVFYPLSP